MANCSFPECDEVLNYLPFRCRYCGGTYCKKHRLPENHKCSFELQIQPKKEVSQELKHLKEEEKKSKNNQIPEDKSYEQIDKEMRNYIREQERAAMPPPPSRTRGTFGSRSRGYSPFISRSSKPIGTYSLMGLSTLFFILSQIQVIPEYILLNLNTLRFEFLTHFPSFFTAILTPNGLISWIFTLLILFWSGKVIEMQMGTKFLLTLYLLSGIANGFAIILLQSIGLFINIPFFTAMTYNLNLYSTQNGAYYGLMVFILYRIGLDREMRFYLYFIPVRMKAKYILYFMIGIQLIYGGFGIVRILLELEGAYYILSSLPQLGGILVGAYFWKKFGRQIVNFV
ncbi:AN1-type zinc finger domain-containing protein [Promethearchaeum syntrophicum]|uniref:AN1-type zinc finger domain-containing protein n=1 Tax=Promethearchaeum syntrophicum TaxID=2594042 RepID=A0A5B9D6C0_9ARCH|nr:AN1-type zinc finger domain-containing protein [Candidatus Prometheoarchaeum syntrophicum]QEE14543.1 AN1-like Zinc finger [Candidatus Prometheoarchaeum syntrophicum]